MALLAGGKDYTDIVKTYIEKIFKHEAKKYQCEPHDLMILLDREEGGNIKIMTYSKPDNKTWRVIPDKEVEQILMK
jgi:hypothetical protein